MFLNQSNQLT